MSRIIYKDKDLIVTKKRGQNDSEIFSINLPSDETNEYFYVELNREQMDKLINSLINNIDKK